MLLDKKGMMFFYHRTIHYERILGLEAELEKEREINSRWSKTIVPFETFTDGSTREDIDSKETKLKEIEVVSEVKGPIILKKIAKKVQSLSKSKFKGFIHAAGNTQSADGGSVSSVEDKSGKNESKRTRSKRTNIGLISQK